MERFTLKDFTTSRDLSYRYLVSPSSQSSRSQTTLVFLHGWPDSSYLWQFIAPKFLSQNYRVLLLDLLGLGQSSKPTDASLYGVGHICKDLAEILDSEDIHDIIPIGHDFGSAIAQRMYLFYPDRCKGLVLLNVTYTPPMKAGAPGPKTVGELNDFFEQMDGYRRFEYHSFFLQPDAAQICEKNLDRFWMAMHRDKGAEGFKQMFCEPGFLRNYVSTDREHSDPLKPYAQDPAVRDAWIEESVKNGGLDASLNYYRAIWAGHHAEAEKDIPGGETSGVVKIPVLYLYADEDVLCPLKDTNQQQQAGNLPRLTIREIHAGHWIPYEKPEEVTTSIQEWLEEQKL